MSKIITLDVTLLKEIAMQWSITLLLFLIMAKLLYKPVAKFMENRRNHIDSQINDAAKLKEEAIKLKKEYDEKITEINKEADLIISEAHKKATSVEDEMIKKAKEEAEEIKQRVQKDTDLFKDRVKDDIRKEIIDVSAVLANKIISISINEEKQRELIEESIKEIGDVKWLA